MEAEDAAVLCASVTRPELFEAIFDRYHSITLPDSSIASGYESAPDFFTTVIHVVETGGGWTVSEWEASGC